MRKGHTTAWPRGRRIAREKLKKLALTRAPWDTTGGPMDI
jgi:hypothetical protein